MFSHFSVVLINVLLNLHQYTPNEKLMAHTEFQDYALFIAQDRTAAMLIMLAVVCLHCIAIFIQSFTKIGELPAQLSVSAKQTNAQAYANTCVFMHLCSIYSFLSLCKKPFLQLLLFPLLSLAMYTRTHKTR